MDRYSNIRTLRNLFVLFCIWETRSFDSYVPIFHMLLFIRLQMLSLEHSVLYLYRSMLKPQPHEMKYVSRSSLITFKYFEFGSHLRFSGRWRSTKIRLKYRMELLYISVSMNCTWNVEGFHFRLEVSLMRNIFTFTLKLAKTLSIDFWLVIWIINSHVKIEGRTAEAT